MSAKSRVRIVSGNTLQASCSAAIMEIPPVTTNAANCQSSFRMVGRLTSPHWDAAWNWVWIFSVAGRKGSVSLEKA